MNQCTCIHCETQREKGVPEYLALLYGKFLSNGSEILTTDKTKATLFTAAHMRDDGGFGPHVSLQKHS